MTWRIALYFCIIFFLSCEPDSSGDSKQQDVPEIKHLFKLVDSQTSKINFINEVQESAERNGTTFPYLYHGSGIAIGDINNDGLEDIFFGGNDSNNALYVNEGNLQFKDISNSAGIISDKWVNGVTMVDINKDGWLDIYLCTGGPYDDPQKLRNELYVNNQDGTFTEQAEKYGLAVVARSVHAVFADFDKDKDLDVFITNHLRRNIGGSMRSFFENYQKKVPDAEKPMMSNMFLENNGDVYSPSAKRLGLDKMAFGGGLVASDFNGDNWTDIYAANADFIPDYYYINNQNGNFSQSHITLQNHMPFNSHGIDAADFNNDGKTDLFITDIRPADKQEDLITRRNIDVPNYQLYEFSLDFPSQWETNALMLNRSQGVLTNIAPLLDLEHTGYGWSPLFADFDNDGYKDLFISTGNFRNIDNLEFRATLAKKEKELGRKLNDIEIFEAIQAHPQIRSKNRIFKNVNGLDFEDMTDNWIPDETLSSTSAAYADLDLDGDLDLVVSNISEKVSVYENTANTVNKGMSVSLSDEYNIHSTHQAKVYVYQEAKLQFRENNFTHGHLSNSSRKLHFGLGANENIDSIVIRYNDDIVEIFEDVIPSPVLDLKRSNFIDTRTISSRSSEWLLDISDRIEDFTLKYIETRHRDYKAEPYLPFKYSNMGPGFAVGDINNDQGNDFFVGSTNGVVSKIFLQAGSTFYSIREEAFLEDSQSEDLGAAFFDYNNDGRQDIYIATGGGGEIKNDDLLKDRLYINAGNGRMLKVADALPDIRSSSKVVIPSDFNGDGRIDVFVAGRNVPGKYPLRAQSQMLIHQGGPYQDELSRYFTEAELPGMISDAVLKDMNQDGREDLVVVGEYSEPKIFLREDEGFVSLKVNSFENLKGWWQSLIVDDLDKDGDLDIVIGNISNNTNFKASQEEPIIAYAGDFDANGRHDVIFAQRTAKGTFPIYGLEVMQWTLPKLGDGLSASEFASKDIHETIDFSVQCDSFEITHLDHIVALNKGNLEFELAPLPFAAQLGAINDMVANDINGDGHLDILAVGNHFFTGPVNVGIDGSRGVLMLGDGTGSFKSDPDIDFLGVDCSDEAKSIAPILLGRNKMNGFLVGNNHGQLQVLLRNR